MGMQVTVPLQALRMFQSDQMCILFCQIPPDPHSNELTPAESQEIDTMCISPAEETLAISTDRGQLYSFSLSSVEMNKVDGPLYQHQHCAGDYSSTSTWCLYCLPCVVTVEDKMIVAPIM